MEQPSLYNVGQINRLKLKMNANANSDSDPTIAATMAFEAILSEVQTSNLNFRIEVSPFSAVINLKKSLITNRFGIPVKPTLTNSILLQEVKSENIALIQKIINLENIVKSMKSDYEDALMDSESCHKAIASLENELQMSRSNVDKIKEETSVKIENETSKDDLLLKSRQIKTLCEENGELRKHL